jgi:MoxR-like ATPase
MPDAALSAEEVESLLAAVELVTVSETIEEYILDIVRSTRTDSRFLRGVSTRGAVALFRAVRAYALVRGRKFVIPEDVRDLCIPVLAHRVLARSGGSPTGDGGGDAIRGLLDELPAPR